MSLQLLTDENITHNQIIDLDIFTITNKRLIYTSKTDEKFFIGINQIGSISSNKIIFDVDKLSEHLIKKWALRMMFIVGIPFAVYMVFASEYHEVGSAILGGVFALILFTLTGGVVISFLTYVGLSVYNSYTRTQQDTIQLDIVKTDNTIFLRRHYIVDSQNDIQNFELLVNDVIFSKV